MQSNSYLSFLQHRGQKVLVTSSYPNSKSNPTCGHFDSRSLNSLKFWSTASSIPRINSKLKYLILMKYIHIKFEIFRVFFTGLAAFVIVSCICMTVTLIFNVLIFVFLPYFELFFQIFWSMVGFCQLFVIYFEFARFAFSMTKDIKSVKFRVILLLS